MAAKHADDPAAWRAGLREFYADQASHIGNTMRIPMRVARAYAAQHGTELETTGVPLVTGTTGDEWEREEATALALLATDCDRAA
jgi:hypothetical protein